jgi:hypothetical protein
MLVQAQKLIDGGLERADMVGSGFITSEGQIRWINDCYAELYDVILRCNEDDYVSYPPLQFTVSSGDLSNDLPADFFKMVGLDKQFGGKWVEIRKFSFNRRNRLKSSFLYTARTFVPAIRYRIVGNKILFDSQDDASGTYQLWYIPVPPEVTNVADNFSIESRSHRQFIELSFAIKALEKEESDVSTLMAERSKLEADILATKINRDEGEPDRISNYDNYENHYSDNDGWY